MREVAELIKDQNQQTYHTRGLELRPPLSTGLREIDVYTWAL
jgi:hypothetical protein